MNERFLAYNNSLSHMLTNHFACACACACGFILERELWMPMIYYIPSVQDDCKWVLKLTSLQPSCCLIHEVRTTLIIPIIVEAPIPDHDPISNLKGTTILIRLGLNFQSCSDLILIRMDPIVPWHMSLLWVLKWGRMSGYGRL